MPTRRRIPQPLLNPPGLSHAQQIHAALATPPPERPTEPCYTCGGSGWWLLPDASAWRCTTCHPAPGATRPAAVLSADRVALLRMAKALGYPRWQLADWRTVGEGEAGWHVFARTADASTIAAMLATKGAAA